MKRNNSKSNTTNSDSVSREDTKMSSNEKFTKGGKSSQGKKRGYVKSSQYSKSSKEDIEKKSNNSSMKNFLSPYILTGVNTSRTTNTFFDIQLAAMGIEIGLDKLIKSKTAPYLLDDLEVNFNRVINAYSTSRGYTSSTTGKIMLDAISYSVKMYSCLIAMKRVFDAWNIKTANNIDILPYLNTKYAFSVQSAILAAVHDTPVDPTGYNMVTAISNAVWAQTYLSQLPVIYLTEGLEKMIRYMFGNEFTNNPQFGIGNSTLFNIWPVDSTGVTLLAGFSTAQSALSALYSTYPDLQILLELAGFSPKWGISQDFTRDLTGQTINVVYDPQLIAALESTGALDPTNSVFSARNYIRLDNTGDNIFACAQTRPIDVFDNLWHWLFNLPIYANITGAPVGTDIIKINAVINILYNEGSQKAFYYIPNHLCITYSLSSTVKTTPALLNKALTAIANAVLPITVSTATIEFNADFVLSQVATIDRDSVEPANLSVTLAPAGNPYLKEGCTTYIYNMVEAAVIVKNLLPTIFYGVDWRINMQALLKVVTDRASSINY